MLYKQVFPQPQAGIVQKGEVTLPDQDILRRAFRARNGEKVQRLYSGDSSGYTSQSEADGALVMLLGFYTQDKEQLDRLFRSSGLYREKWDKQLGKSTYGARTIEYALRGLRKTYTPGGGKGGRAR